MAKAQSILTVGDLIAKLGEFDPASPIRVQHGLKSETQFIVTAGPTPDEPGAIAVIYIEKAED
jgi:hypothetical protein